MTPVSVVCRPAEAASRVFGVGQSVGTSEEPGVPGKNLDTVGSLSP